MWESILSNILSQAPWTAIIVLVIYFVYRELKHSVEELREADERILKEMRESDGKILTETKEADERILKEMRESDERRRGEMKESEGRIMERIDRVIRRIDRVALASEIVHEAMWGLLTRKEVITVDETSYLKMISDSVFELALANPISKEEWIRMKALHDKDISEITHEEALKLYNFAKRVIDEMGEHREAWHLFTYAIVLKYMTLKKEMEKRKEDEEKKKSK